MTHDLRHDLRHELRCFRRRRKGELRHGVWVIGRFKGWFFHGDRNDLEGSKYSSVALLSAPEFAEQIDPFEALQELDSWPQAQEAVKHIFKRGNLTMREWAAFEYEKTGVTEG